MLDHDRLNLGIGQEFEELGTTSVQAGTDLGYGFHNAHAVVVSVNDEATELCFQISCCSGEETRA